MVDLFIQRRKTIGKTTDHVERAIAVADMCLSIALDVPFDWNSRTIKTTGILEDTSQEGHKLFGLSALVTIDGKVKPHLCSQKSVAVTVEFSGHQDYHDPSGEVVSNLDKFVKVVVKLTDGMDTETYIFKGPQIPVTTY